ncbi:hypothetical protein MBLNU230_g6629t1 [Neophaeotheca triangularis]
MTFAPKTQYEPISALYNSLSALPQMQLENAMITTALGDCTNQTVLDLGGGSGLHARKAVTAGAARVDCLDISPAMLELGKQIETELEREGAINWHVADATQALDHLPLLEGGYDVILACWVFDHATTPDELHAMWRNAAKWCKPGGRMVNIRVTRPDSPNLRRPGKYGVYVEGLVEIAGGVKYEVCWDVEPGFRHEATTMAVSASLDGEVHKRHGFGGLRVLRPEEMEVVQQDLEFWGDFVREGMWTVLTLRREGGWAGGNIDVVL